MVEVDRSCVRVQTADEPRIVTVSARSWSSHRLTAPSLREAQLLGSRMLGSLLVTLPGAAAAARRCRSLSTSQGARRVAEATDKVAGPRSTGAATWWFAAAGLWDVQEGEAMMIEQLLAGSTVLGRGHTTHARQWLVTSDAVVCEFGPEDPKGAAWQMLAYGLEYVERHGRHRLILILPETAARVCALRAALLRPGLVEVWRYGEDDQLQMIAVPTWREALPFFSATRPGVEFRPDPQDTAGLPGWLLELGDWVESRAVERVRIRNYWAWHYRGRAVLIVQSRSAKPAGHRVIAGVKYTGTNIGRFGADTYVDFEVSAGEGPTDEQLAAVRGQVDEAIERRRVKVDAGHGEHMLQATIGREPALVGMRHVRRELAAGRLTAGGAAYIDFLGIDDDGRLHVIETKLGHSDAQLGVQGLDYWGWATAHAEELRQKLQGQGHDELDADAEVTLRFVIGMKEPGRFLHAAARATIRALHPDIPWRVQVLDNWDTLHPSHTPLSLPEDVGPLRDRTLP